MCDQSSVCCYQRISVPIVKFVFGMWMLFYFRLSFQCFVGASGGRLYAHEIVVFYPHSTINFLLFYQGSAISILSSYWIQYQRRRARKANIKSSKNKTEVDSAQEAEETERTGKWVMSTEYSHGLN